MDPYHFLTMDRFLPKAKGDKTRTGGFGGRGGSSFRGGRGGAPFRGGSSFRGGNRGAPFRGGDRGGFRGRN